MIDHRRASWVRIGVVVLIAWGFSAASWRAGWLVPLERAVRDAAVRLAPARSGSAFVRIVRIEEADIERFGYPLSDRVVADAIRVLLDRGALAIGLDVYRDQPPGAGREDLSRLVLENEEVVLVRKLPAGSEPGIAPPGFAPAGQVGFTDVVVDGDGAVRRGLLYLWDESGVGHVSLALRVAESIMAQRGLAVSPDPARPDAIRLGDTPLPPLEPDDAFYVGADTGGYQFLLDHALRPENVPALGLGVLLDGSSQFSVDGCAVLIGTVSPSVKDWFPAPFAPRAGGIGLLHGVEVHALAADQLLRLALDGEAPIRSLPESGEALLLLFAALAGALWGMRGLPAAALLAGGASLGVAPLAASAFAWSQRVWIPGVAPALAAALAFGLAAAWSAQVARAERRQILQLFGRFLSPAVARSIWEQRAEFFEGGRPKPRRLPVSILLSDLEGYTSASERLTPDQLIAWMDGYMNRMAVIVEAHGGILDDYAGDGLKADFGVPVARQRPDEIAADAVAAVRCAWEMGEALEQMRVGWRSAGLPTPRLRIGVASGEAVVGSLGGDQRLKFTSLGDLVNLAGRLESVDLGKDAFDAGRCFRIVISERTRELVAAAFETEPLGERVLKGRRTATVLHRVTEPRRD